MVRSVSTIGEKPRFFSVKLLIRGTFDVFIDSLDSSRLPPNRCSTSARCLSFLGDGKHDQREVASGGAEDLPALGGEHREAITLADLEGVSQAEAAARAGISLSGMKSRVQRGRQQLKAVLEECCRVQLDRRGTIVAYDPLQPDSCGPCGSCD